MSADARHIEDEPDLHDIVGNFLGGGGRDGERKGGGEAREHALHEILPGPASFRAVDRYRKIIRRARKPVNAAAGRISAGRNQKPPPAVHERGFPSTFAPASTSVVGRGWSKSRLPAIGG